MSSSPSRTAVPVEVPDRRSAGDMPVEVAPFPYPEISPSLTRVALSPCRSGEGSGLLQAAEEAAVREAKARVLGREEGLSEGRQHFEEQLSRERASLAAALVQFAQDRAQYYQKVEGEVVQLALSIARQILHREAQIDPMLLAGIVRVALEKIEGATGVRLRLHPQNAADWRRYLSTHMDPSAMPELVEDAAMATDRCVLETSMGVAELGIEVQLKEIERGMMDLLAARPRGTA